MNKIEFKELTQGRIVCLDGATGSNLFKAGMPSGVCPELWIPDHKEVLIQLQQDYVRAGSEIVYAPTFGANRIKLAEYGAADRIREINHQLVAISREAVAGQAYVAGNLTMTGRQLKPIGNLELEELIDTYKEQIGYLVEAGVDLLVVETMMSLQESRAVLIAAKEICDLPVMMTMTFEADGRTLYGTDVTTAAIVLESLGADAFGINCSVGPDRMTEWVKEIAGCIRIPIIAKPNAGLPVLGADGNTVYDMGAEEFAAEMIRLIQAGATMAGGCCGTAPEYIKLLKEQIKAVPVPEKKVTNRRRCLTSERRTVSFDLTDRFMIVGERINPTGKKKLQEQLRNNCLDGVIAFAEEQEADGAEILDVNVGMNGIDEREMMMKVMDAVSMATPLPLSIDSSYVEVIEAALRRYPGRALINSISGETAKCEPLLKLAKKYGAMFILLPLSDAGLPKDLDEKISLIEMISEKAFRLGLTKEDIIVDGLVTTVGANKKAALETLETIRYCRENDYATTCGLSNISFGLPERKYINTTFLTMAIAQGLTMAIANPSQELLVSAALAGDLLLGKEQADIRYIERMNLYQAQRANVDVAETTGMADTGGNRKDALYEAVLKGNRNGSVEAARAAIAKGRAPQAILDEILLPAINQVGDLFDQGKYFLPQLIASAEAMKAAIEYLEPLQPKREQNEEMPVVVIATVEGDIHDIGKNLVALMLRNYGFQVIDLGKDVAKEEIIDAAIKYQASIIGLSALMTTTMQEMKAVIDYARTRQVKAGIIVGGAVITQEYADEIGADGYSKDAAEAVKKVKQILRIL